MTSSTLDILLMIDPTSGQDKTGEWETQFDEGNSPKIKFPLKMKDEMSDVNTEFTEPEIAPPVEKKKEKPLAAKVVELGGKKKSKKDKKNLF